MEPKDIKAEFSGFGPLPSSKTTFAQGIGMGGSFAPIWTTEPQLPAPRQPSTQTSEPVTYPFHLTVVSVTEESVTSSKIRIQYGEVDGVPPNGMTIDDDYLIEPGNSFIYIIVTFDGYGRINSRTIGFDNPVPDDTNDTKHIIIGEVEYSGGLYIIKNQNISQDVYPEKALVVDRSDGSFVYSLFADPRKINAIYELENFNVNLDGETLTTTLYLRSEDNSDYLELKKNSNEHKCSVYGYVNNNDQNFLLSAGAESKLQLYDSNSTNYLENRVFSESNEISTYGYAANQSKSYKLFANNSWSQLELFDQNSLNYLQSRIEADKSFIYGYSGSEKENFLISSDAISNISKISLYNQSSVQQLDLVSDSRAGVECCYIDGYSKNQNGRFQLSSATGADQDPYLDLRNDSNYIIKLSVESSNTASKMFLKSASGANVLLKAESTNASLYLEEPTSSKNVFIDVPTNGSGSLVNAFWQELDVCVDGEAKKMKVLGTEPY